MTTQINQLTELTSTSDGDLLLIRENATGVDKKMQASNLRAKATTKDDVGLGDVDNVSAANLRDRSTHTGTQPLSTISDAGNMGLQNKESVNIDGGTIDGTAVNATTLTASGNVNFDSGTLFVNASTNRVGIGTSSLLSNIQVGGSSTGTNKLQIVGNDAFSAGAAFIRTSDGPPHFVLGFGSSGNDAEIGSSCGVIDFNAFHTTNYTTAAQIQGLVDGTPGANSMPGSIAFLTNPGGATTVTEAMRIDSSGNVNLTGGGNLILSNGAGIDFSAHPNAAGMTSELLDDYEEGTWTPTFVNGGTGTYSHRSGHYTKIGDTVFAHFFAQLGAVGTASGALEISGLPFTSAASPSTLFGIGAQIHANLWTTERISPNTLVAPNSTTILFFSGMASTNLLTPTHQDCGTGNILGCMIYKT